MTAMTDTIAADPGYGTDSQDGPGGGTIEHLDPHSLEVGDNVREYANLNRPFLDSIAEHGVLVPLTAIRRPDGVVEVRNGQRRTMAARKAGLSTVPVSSWPRRPQTQPPRRSTASCTRSSPTTRSRTSATPSG